MTQYTSNNKRFCSVFKSAVNPQMYLYVDRKAGTQNLPETLLQLFGQPSHVLDLVLTPDKKLALVDAQCVLTEIAEKGFYLQMPQGKEDDISGAYKPPEDSLHG